MTVKPLTANLKPVNREVILSSKKPKAALDNFELFYEEIAKNKLVSNRVKRIRRAAVTA